MPSNGLATSERDTTAGDTIVARFDAVFGRRASLLLGSLVLTGIGTACFHLLVAGWIPTPDREGFERLLNLLLLIAVPCTAAQVVVVRAASEAIGSGSGLRWRSSASVVVGACAGVGALVVAQSVVWPGPLDVGGPVPALAAAAYLVVAGAGVVPRGVLLASFRFGPVAISAIGGLTVRLATLWFVAAVFGASLQASLLTLLAGELVTTGVLIWSARPSGEGSPVELTIRWRAVGEALLAFAGLWLLVVVETVLAANYLGGDAHRQFSAASDVARLTLFVPQVVVVVALARFGGGGAAAREALRRTLRITALLSLATVATLALFGPSLLTRILPGLPVPPALVLVLGVASGVVSLLYVLVTYHVARGLPSAGTVWLALAGIVIAAWMWHSSAAAFAVAFVLVVLCALARLLAGPALVGPAASWPSVERRHRTPVPESGPELSVVVPFFNPGGQRLRRHLAELFDTLEHERVSFEVVAVSDGSTDHSEASLSELRARGLEVIVLDRNCGKGAALCAGITRARGRYVGFIDADGDIPSRLWHPFLTLMHMYEADMVVGSKRHALSDVQYSTSRRLYSRAYQVLVHMLFRVGVADTQTGIKLFRREVIVDVLPLVVERGFVFDLEVMVVARRRGWRRVLEAPVSVGHQVGSTISPRSVGTMLRQTLVLAVRLHVLRSYDTPATGSTLRPAGTLAVGPR
jgi:hypothetical protein